MPRVKDALPWRKTRKGCEADVGTVFCVELTEEGWRCKVKPQRGPETVVGERLPTEAAARQIAQRSYAREKQGRGRAGEQARASKKTEAKKTPKKTEAKTQEPEARAAPTEEPSPPQEKQLISDVLEVEDGCLCGKANGVRWVADRGGVVEFVRAVEDGVAERVRSEVAKLFAAKPRRGRPPRQPPDSKAETSKAETSEAETEAETSEPPKRRGRPARAESPGKSGRRGRPPGSKNKPKGTEKPTEPKRRGRPPKSSATDTPVNEVPAPKRRGRPPGSGKKPTVAASDEEKGPANGKSELKWSEVGGNLRATVPSGYFELVPEGTEYALYFADMNGASTFLKNGEKSTLMQVAAERNSRGMGAAPAAVASTNLDELFAQAIRG